MSLKAVTLAQVLRSAGVRCVVRLPDRDLPAEASHLVPVLREAVTNVLRHSRAAHCTIDVHATGALWPRDR